MNQFFRTLFRFVRTGRINFIDPSAKIGRNVVIWNFAVILKDAVIEDNVSIGSNSEIGAGCTIGKGSRISAHVFLPPNSFIGEDSFIGPGAIFTDDKRPRANNTQYVAEPPILENESSVGAGVVVLPGRRIGSGAMVGAGSIVAKDVAAGTTVRCDRARERLDGLKVLNREHGWYDSSVR